MKRFTDAVEDRTDGAIQFEETYGTSLGSQDEINELLINGGLDMAIHGAPPSDEYLGLFLPYVFTDAEHLQRVIDSPVGDTWAADAKKKVGVVVNQVWSRGMRDVYLRDPADNIDDLEGRRIRVAEIDGSILAVKAMGATPVVMSFDELFTSLGSGLVDGAENTLGQIIAEHHNEVTCCVLKTEHSVSPVFWMSNGDWWDGLDPKVQKLLTDEIDSASAWAVDQGADDEAEWESQLEDAGMDIVTPDSLDPLREAAKEEGVDDAATKLWGADAYDKIKELADE